MDGKYGFIEFYIDYSKLRTDADPEFAKISAILLLGNAIGKNWINRLQPDRIYHNIYAVLIGESTISRKTTLLDMAKEIYPEMCRMPEEYSPESYIKNLEKHSQSITFIDELTMILKSATNRSSYMARILEMWCTLHKYKSEYFRRSLQNKEFEVKNPYPSILGATVPSLLNDVVTKEMMEGGSMARFLLVYGKSNPKPRGRTPEIADKLEKHFKAVIEHLIVKSQKEAVEFVLTDDALNEFENIETELYKEYDDILPFAGRYLEYIISIADIMKLSEIMYNGSNLTDLIKLTNLNELTRLTTRVQRNIDELIYPVNSVKTVNLIIQKPKIIVNVEKEYIIEAYNFIKPSLEYARRLQNYVSISKPVATLKDFLQDNTPCDHSYTMQRTHLDGREMQIARETLGILGQDYIFEIKIQPEGRGRIKTVYCLKHHIGTEKCQKCKWNEGCKLYTEQNVKTEDNLE